MQQPVQQQQETLLELEINEFHRRKKDKLVGHEVKDRKCLVCFLVYQWMIYLLAVFAFTFG